MSLGQGLGLAKTGSPRVLNALFQSLSCIIRSRREVPTDCAGFITVVELVITLVEKTPASKEVRLHCIIITVTTTTTIVMTIIIMVFSLIFKYEYIIIR